MLSSGSPSKWQMQDSRSTSRRLYSKSEPTEEYDAFSSEGEGTRSSESSPESVKQRAGRDESGHAEHPSISPVYTDQSSAKRIPTEGDVRFASKCSELRGFVGPLLELLNGLKTGRFEKGLSTYQKSVAMDRLRKILGVLQKPDLGEKYLGILLQLEVMLKVWFPQVIPQQPDGSSSFHSPSAGQPPRWNQDQLHIPVKKRRLSLSDTDSQGSSSCKLFHEEERGRSLSDAGSWLSSSETTSSDLEDDNAMCANQKEMASELELTKHSSLNSLQQKTASLNSTPVPTTGKPPLLVIPPLARGGSSVRMQDCSVSSTTPTSDSRTDLKNDEKDAACPVATQERCESMKEEGPKKQTINKSYRTMTPSSQKTRKVSYNTN